MKKYRITIITCKKWDDEPAERRTTCVYSVECANMSQATGKADRYACFQLKEENADYVKHISISEVTPVDAALTEVIDVEEAK